MINKKFIINNENVEYYTDSIAKWIKEQVQTSGARGVVPCPQWWYRS